MTQSSPRSKRPEGALGDLGEEGLLKVVFAELAEQPTGSVLLGAGDDTAWLRVRGGAVLATTDSVVRGRDWRDDWSSAEDVGIKVVTQNLADLAAMGGSGTGLLTTLIAPESLPVSWAQGLTRGIAHAAAAAGVPVLGGDLSSAPEPMVAVSVTGLGELGEGVTGPVSRSGAAAGDVLAVSGQLGRSGAGWQLLQQGVLAGDDQLQQEVLKHHRRPVVDLRQGPIAARAGATAMIDLSDGLVRDADRIARASGVALILDEGVAALARHLEPAIGSSEAMAQVLAGGEEHELLATFPTVAAVPEGWIVLGRAELAQHGDSAGAEGQGDAEGAHPGGVWWRGRRLNPRVGGWDHFGG